MSKLIYATNVSFDGWTEDAQGRLDWAPPDDDVFAAITDLMGSVGTYLYGRRMYEVMAVWETDPALAAQSDLTRRFADTWKEPDKVVYSTTLAEVVTARTRLERSLDLDAIRDLKATTARDLLVGGPTLAAQVLAAGLVDELRLFVWPVVLGGTKAALAAGSRIDLELVDAQRIGNGVVDLRYRTA